MVKIHQDLVQGVPAGTPATREIPQKTPVPWRVLGRLALAGLLLLALSRQVSWPQLWAVWQGLAAWSIGLACLLTLLSMLVSGFKWRLVLAEPGLTSPGTRKLMRYYLIGLFFNNFLPSGIGGDVVRVAMAGKSTGIPRAAASVVTERLLASVGLVLPSLVFAFFYRSQLGAIAGLIPMLAVVVVIMILACFYPGWNQMLDRYSRRWPRLAQGFTGFLQSLQSYSGRRAMLFQVVLWSVIFQGIVIIINYVLFLGLAIPVSLGACAVIIPIISALTMVPLSINGLGLREWGYVALFAPFGVDTTAAVAVSFSFFLVVVLVSLIGGVLYVLERQN